MKTEYEIYMDFKVAEEQVEKLRRIAQIMSTLANDDMTGTLSSIKNNWTGENSEAYLAKGHLVRDKISGTAADISKTADALEKIAVRIRDAEIAAIRIATD